MAVCRPSQPKNMSRAAMLLQEPMRMKGDRRNLCAAVLVTCPPTFKRVSVLPRCGKHRIGKIHHRARPSGRSDAV
jgi:hypothetical protein